MQRTNEQLELQEEYTVCSHCLTVYGSFQSECPSCPDHAVIEYWTLWEWFSHHVPMKPIIGQKLILPTINFFDAQDILNILATGDVDTNSAAA